MDFDNLKLPEDLEKLSKKEIEELCNDLRKALVTNVSKTGGHLASNLGVVELTVALYSIYNPFEDRIIWDVGHQTYVHKMLTGRNAEMATLRQADGMSGFPKREDSAADAFNTGHSSTSISAALGIARGNLICGNNVSTVAIIGDGALSGGLAFEALNDTASSKMNMTIVLNDNGMSISKNVGGLAKYLLKIRTREGYVKAKTDIRITLNKIPLIGKPLATLLRKIKNSIKFMFTTGAFFEDMGLNYIGPVDGHDVKALKNALKSARSHEGPSIVHVMTTKGKGYEPAEDDPSVFHGIGPFDAESGKIIKGNTKQVSMSAVFGETIEKMAAEDDKICAITAAMPVGTGLEAFKKSSNKKVIDVGIAEEHAVTMAAGMSVAGAKPVVAVYSTFMQRAYDELLHDVSIQEVPLLITLDRAGVAGADGETHQGIYDISYMYHMHNSTVIAPSSHKELVKAIHYGMNIYDADERTKLGIPSGAFVIRYPAKDRMSDSYIEMMKDDEFEYGKGVKYEFEGEGKRVLIVSLGEMLEYAFEAAETLKNDGLNVTVYDARFAKPVDRDGIYEIAKDADLIVTVEDGVYEGGFGVHLKAAMDGFAAPEVVEKIKIKAIPDSVVRQGTIAQIHRKYELDAEGIVKTVREALS